MADSEISSFTEAGAMRREGGNQALRSLDCLGAFLTHRCSSFVTETAPVIPQLSDNAIRTWPKSFTDDGWPDSAPQLGIVYHHGHT